MKPVVKRFFRQFFLLMAVPLYVLERLCSGFREKDNAFWSFSQFLSLLPGKWGAYLRGGFYRLTLDRCGKDCAIMFGTIFAQRETEIGEGVYIGPQCNIGMCIIEDNCIIGSGVHIISGKRQHNFEDVTRPIRDQGGNFEKIRVGEDTWIGNGSIVMANIGKKCIVGAGSVITRDIEDFCIVAGNPARVLKKRSGVFNNQNDGRL